jgi:hypothetical protein
VRPGAARLPEEVLAGLGDAGGIEQRALGDVRCDGAEALALDGSVERACCAVPSTAKPSRGRTPDEVPICSNVPCPRAVFEGPMALSRFHVPRTLTEKACSSSASSISRSGFDPKRPPGDCDTMARSIASSARGPSVSGLVRSQTTGTPLPPAAFTSAATFSTSAAVRAAQSTRHPFRAKCPAMVLPSPRIPITSTVSVMAGAYPARRSKRWSSLHRSSALIRGEPPPRCSTSCTSSAMRRFFGARAPQLSASRTTSPFR